MAFCDREGYAVADRPFLADIVGCCQPLAGLVGVQAEADKVGVIGKGDGGYSRDRAESSIKPGRVEAEKDGRQRRAMGDPSRDWSVTRFLTIKYKGRRSVGQETSYLIDGPGRKA